MDDEQLRARLQHAAPDPGAAPTSAIVQRGRRRRAAVGVSTAVVLVLAAVSVIGVLTGRSADMPVIDDPPTEATPTPDSSAEPTPTPATSPTDAPSSDGAATPDPTTASPSPEPTRQEVVLRGDGLSVASVGDHFDQAVAALTDALGEPREDTGWTAQSEQQSWLGICSSEHPYWRGVAWGQLSVIFVSSDSEGGPDAALTSWGYGARRDVPPDESPLTTEAGLGVGDTRDRAVELYGDQVTYIEGDEVVDPWLRIDTDDSERFIQAILSREDHQTIRWFAGGEPCGE